MEIGLHANMCDRDTNEISDMLRSVFKLLCEKLNGNYGGIIEHLWIDFELIKSHAKPDGKPRHPFRFQKRVSGRSSFGLPPSPDYHNVGHFSVRPNFSYLIAIPKSEVIPYCLSLIYKELLVLSTKEKKLGGFKSELFRNRFSEECMALGYSLNENML
ncbi:hypothetical protein ACSVH2_06175 [Flavobacterium sp. RSB2_4_14]|uniref:hypothetical protein n=1 Tax=Flavobacterium sp. RSB2_4_14 TaxID=3447665 RepID=UPI003F3981B9